MVNVTIPDTIYFKFYKVIKQEYPGLSDTNKIIFARRKIVEVLRSGVGLPLKRRETREICIKCGSSDDVCTHHIDHNHSNNNPENLTFLCRRCHTQHHTGGIMRNGYSKYSKRGV